MLPKAFATAIQTMFLLFLCGTARVAPSQTPAGGTIEVETEDGWLALSEFVSITARGPHLETAGTTSHLIFHVSGDLPLPAALEVKSFRLKPPLAKEWRVAPVIVVVLHHSQESGRRAVGHNLRTLLTKHPDGRVVLTSPELARESLVVLRRRLSKKESGARGLEDTYVGILLLSRLDRRFYPIRLRADTMGN